MGFFSKDSPKKKKSNTADTKTILKDSNLQPTAAASPPLPPSSPSPSRKSPSRAIRDRDTRASSSSSAHSPRPTKGFSRAHKSSRQISTGYPRDTHPLNLPPEERERERRRSALLGMSDTTRESMEVDQEEVVSATPSSPPPTSPGPFPNTNGVDHMEGVMNGNGSPVPPPHRIPIPTEPQPPPKPTIDAEACKTAGNKFFRMRDYDKAIREYSKGEYPDF